MLQSHPAPLLRRPLKLCLPRLFADVTVAGMAVMALMLWLPVMVQSLLSGGDPTQLVSSSKQTSAQHSMPDHSSHDSTGTLAVLLTAIPFTCAAVLTTTLGAVAQRTGRPLVYYFTPNFIGGTAFLVFPWVVHASRVAGFAMLTIALACGYASSPHPMTAITQIVAGTLAEQRATSSMAQPHGGTAADDAQGTALPLPMYNTVAMLGGFFGPWLLGVAVERLGGFSAGAVAMGVCMLSAGAAVFLLWRLHPPTAAAGRYVRCGGVPSSRCCTELAQQGREHAVAVDPCASSATVCRRPSDSAGRGKQTAAGSMGRLKLLKSSGALREQERLLPGGAADECVAHDAQLPARRDGGSPRVRLPRGKHAAL